MTETDAIEICREAILVMLVVSGPMMLVMLVVGVVVSLFQALTQIQEQTLTFIPKMVLGFATAIFLAPFMVSHLTVFTQHIADRIVAIGSQQ
ncbi:MAG: flagellar biosynthesis protein FliQ [Rhodospirillaceae bacterium]